MVKKAGERVTGEKYKTEKEINKLKKEAKVARETHENSMVLIKKTTGTC